MPLQNRVLPTGEIVVHPARADFMGNRGILHGGNRQLGTARWRHKAWITCLLSFKGRKRVPMTPGRYTELFFLDEAVALAAGHRPCAECRRADFLRYRDAWQAPTGVRPSAADMDHALHAARVTPRRAQITHEADIRALPDGVFLRVDAGGPPCLLLGARLLPFTPGGYGPALPHPASGAVTVLTPRPSVAVLAAGYRPALHASAG